MLSILHYAPSGFRVVMLSTDHDRSRDVIESVRGFMRRDVDSAAGVRWRRAQGLHEGALGAGIETTRDQIRTTTEGRDVVVKCVATDGGSASGERADLFIVNEVQSWSDPHGGRVWTESFARFEKKRGGRLAVLSNLPFTSKGDWRRDAWESARASDSGWTYIPVRLADCPWITPERLERQKKSLLPTAFRRLYLCEPTDGRGELIEAAWYDACVRAGTYSALGPDLPGKRFVGCDLGLSKDHAVLVLLRLDIDGAVTLERIDVWVPSQQFGGEVSLAQVRERLCAYGREWHADLLLDPFQAKLIAQELQAEGLTVEVVPSTTKSSSEQTEAVVNLFRDGRLRVWPDAGKTTVSEGHVTSLRQQLLDAEVKEVQKGAYKVVQKRTRLGHGDQVSALMLAAYGVAKAGAYSPPVAVGSSSLTAPEERRPPALRHRQFVHGDHGRSTRYRLPRGDRWAS